MKTITLVLACLFSNMVVAAPLSPPPKIVVRSEDPALLVKDVRIDTRDGKVRGTVFLRFGYEVPRLPHVHVYGLNAAGKVIDAGCGKLNGTLISGGTSGKPHEEFSARLTKLDGVTSVLVVASARHSGDCRPEDNRIIKLF